MEVWAYWLGKDLFGHKTLYCLEVSQCRVIRFTRPVGRLIIPPGQGYLRLFFADISIINFLTCPRNGWYFSQIHHGWSRFSFPIFPDFSTRKYFSVLIVLQTRPLYVKCYNFIFFIQSVTISVPFHSLLWPKKLSCHEEENGKGQKKMTLLTDDGVEIPAFIKRDGDR